MRREGIHSMQPYILQLSPTPPEVVAITAAGNYQPIRGRVVDAAVSESRGRGSTAARDLVRRAPNQSSHVKDLNSVRRRMSVEAAEYDHALLSIEWTESG